MRSGTWPGVLFTMLVLTAWVAGAPPAGAQPQSARATLGESRAAPSSNAGGGATGADLTVPPAPAPETRLEGPVDRFRYRLGPGDLVDVRIRTRPLTDRTLRVSPEGLLVFPEAASIPVAGVTLAQADSTVGAALSFYYKTSDVEIRLLEIRTFGVFVVGQVRSAGIVEASPTERVSEVIARAGGLLENASSRAIVLTRASGETIPVDLGLFAHAGSLAHNPEVDAGDRIYVPPMTAVATVTGAVRRTGDFEVAPGDSVATAVALAYGLREDALLDSAYIESFAGSPRHTTRTYLDLARGEDRRRPIRERDLIFIRPRPNWTGTRSVQLIGEVRYPGTHALPADSIPLTRLIALAGGFTEFASLGEAFVLRKQTDLPADPEFERLSKLPSSEMSRSEYEYYALKLRSQKQSLSVDFVALFQRGDTRYDINISPGDIVNVPRRQPFVVVTGEIARPGSIPFEPTWDVNTYIERAGGYTVRADRKRVAVIRAMTGEWARKSKVHRLGPGDTVWVPQKQPTDYWKLTLGAISLLAQLSTTYLVIHNAVGP
jgi:protein involved in polysaccharide export with SLBB domain